MTADEIFFDDLDELFYAWTVQVWSMRVICGSEVCLFCCVSWEFLENVLILIVVIIFHLSIQPTRPKLG